MYSRYTAKLWTLRLLAALTALVLLGLFHVAISQEPLTTEPANTEQPIDEASLADGQSPIETKNLLQVIHDGGPLMYPIAICSFVFLVFVFERMISLRRGRIIPAPFVKRFLEQINSGQLEREEALALCEENQSPVAEVFGAAVKKWGKTCVEVEQAIIDAGERVTHGLRRYLRVLNGVATVSPLMGLLGTVLGMIHAFNNIAAADAMGRPERLATGISQALLTTAAGLSVAIPALICYLYFVGRVDRLIIELDSLGQKVVNAIASDAWDGRSSRRSTRKRRPANTSSDEKAA